MPLKSICKCRGIQAANSWPGIIYSRGMAVHGMYLESENTTASWRKLHLSQGRYIELWACGLHTFYIKPSTIHPISSTFMGIIVFLRF